MCSSFYIYNIYINIHKSNFKIDLLRSSGNYIDALILIHTYIDESGSDA